MMTAWGWEKAKRGGSNESAVARDVRALRACAADGGCADPRECGRLCAATLEPHKEEAEEIEDADE